jgi:cytoskeletal protein CcmA (bactofilin family)
MASTVIGAGITIEGEIVVAGSLTGNITAQERVDLQTGARVIGNVKAARVTIADGAQFKGSVDMDV